MMEKKNGRESPEIPGAPGVGDRRARPGRGCRNGEHVRPRCRRAGRRSRTSCVTRIWSPRSPVFVTAQGRALQQPGSGPCAPSCHRGIRHGERHDESHCAGVRKMDLPSWLPLRELSSWTDHADHTTAIRGLLQGFLREDDGGHPWRRPRGCRPRHWTHRIRVLVEGVVHGVKAVATDCVLRFWSPSRPVHRGLGPRILPPPIGGRPLKTVYSCAWRRSRGQAPLVPFRRLHGAQGRSAGDFLTAVPR